MRKFVLSLAAAGAAVAFATPAAAQYYPQPQYGYGQGYGQNYGYGQGYGYNHYGNVRALQARINYVERQIARLDRRNRIGDREADRLRHEANRIERRLYSASRYGLNPYEANDIQRRISVLEQRVRYATAYGWGRYGRQYGWNGNYGYNGYNGGYYDRDRDGRDDRWEDDRGRDHDGRRGDRDDD